jgi:hypothetical protein
MEGMCHERLVSSSVLSCCILRLTIAGGERIRQRGRQMLALIWRCQVPRNGEAKC